MGLLGKNRRFTLVFVLPLMDLEGVRPMAKALEDPLQHRHLLQTQSPDNFVEYGMQNVEIVPIKNPGMQVLDSTETRDAVAYTGTIVQQYLQQRFGKWTMLGDMTMVTYPDKKGIVAMIYLEA